MKALLTKLRQRTIEGLSILVAIIATVWMTTLTKVAEPITFIFADGTTDTVITYTYAEPTTALLLIAIIVIAIIVMLFMQSRR